MCLNWLLVLQSIDDSPRTNSIVNHWFTIEFVVQCGKHNQRKHISLSRTHVFELFDSTAPCRRRPTAVPNVSQQVHELAQS